MIEKRRMQHAKGDDVLHSSVLLNWRPVHTQEAWQKYCSHIISAPPALVKQNPRKTVKRKAPERCPGLFCVRILLPFEHDPEIASDINESEYSRINGFGRGRRLRTLGLRFWRPPLYQLSYSPIYLKEQIRLFL